jgi:alpha-N-arabinofuranosidase
MMEVTQGPYLMDNNIFASEYNFDNIAQGGAYVNNLCCGTMRREAVLNRSTPYHFPHTTQVASTALVYSGDDRLYQNISPALFCRRI